jgi:hypothetical protein
LGEYFFYTEKYDDAIEQYGFSKKLAEKYNLLNENSDATQRIAECLEMKGDFKTAYQLSSEFALLQGDILKKVKQDDSEINENYTLLKENEQKLIQKLRENKLQEQIINSNRLNWILIFIFLAFIGVLVYFRRKK